MKYFLFAISLVMAQIDLGAYPVDPIVWKGLYDGDWNTAANWVEDFVPISTSNAQFSASYKNSPYSMRALLNADAEIKKLSMNVTSRGGTLTLAGSNTLTVPAFSFDNKKMGTNSRLSFSFVCDMQVAVKSNDNLIVEDSANIQTILKFTNTLVVPMNLTLNSYASCTLSNTSTVGGEISVPSGANLTNNGTLTSTGTTTINGVFVNTGTWTQTFTGSNYIKVYNKISNTGTINGYVDCSPGGKCEGTGYVQDLRTNSSTLRPRGSSPGTMTIGDLILGDHSIIELETDFITPSEIIVINTVDIGDDVEIHMILDETTEAGWENFLENGYSFEFFNAGGTITGTFGAISSPLPGFRFQMSNILNVYTMDVEALPLASLVSDSNQQTVANIFDQDYSHQSPDFLLANMHLYFLDLSELENALNQLHPALFNGIALAQEETTSYITKILSQRLEEITWKNPDLKDRKWNVWGQAIRDYAHQKGKSNLHGYHATTPGVIVGADVKIQSNFSFGIEGSYTNTHLGWEAHQGYGHTATGYGGLYGSWYNQNFLVGLSLIGGWNSTKATRSIDFGEIERNAHHRQHGWEIAPQIELGGLYEMKYISFQPFLKENYVYLHQNHYREHGADSLCLDVRAKNADLLRSELGLGLFHCFKGKQLQFTPELKASYILESRFQGKKTTAFFMNDTFETFTVKGLSPSRSLGHLGVLLKGSSYNGFDLTLDYNFQFGKKYQDHKMALRLNYAF